VPQTPGVGAHCHIPQHPFILPHPLLYFGEHATVIAADVEEHVAPLAQLVDLVGEFALAPTLLPPDITAGGLDHILVLITKTDDLLVRQTRIDHEHQLVFTHQV
jgi:hypothetical protein